MSSFQSQKKQHQTVNPATNPPKTRLRRTSKIIRRNDVHDRTLHRRRVVRSTRTVRERHHRLSPHPTRVGRKRYHASIDAPPLSIHPHPAQPRGSQGPRGEKHPSDHVLERVPDVRPGDERQRVWQEDAALGEHVHGHGGCGRGGEADAVVEHPLIDVVGEHEDGVDVLTVRAVGHTYARDRHGAEADWTESVPKHGQGVRCRGICGDGVCFHGANLETEDIRATESQGCDSIPLKDEMYDWDEYERKRYNTHRLIKVVRLKGYG